MIVVTTPTGQIGRHVVRHCLAGEGRLRVIARKPQGLPVEVRRKVDVMAGSHGDARVIDEALAGAEALFWLVPPQPRQDPAEDYTGFTKPAARAIRRQGVSRVVTVQAISGGTRWAETAGLATASQHMADVLASTGVGLRSLAAPSLMDNLLMQADTIGAQGVFRGAYVADKKMPHVAARDLAAAAATLLLDRSWNGVATLPLLGPEDLSMNEIAEIMTDVLETPVRYEQVPYDKFAARLQDGGMPDSYVRAMIDMMRAKNEGLDNTPLRDRATTTPTTFRQWCEDVLVAAVRIRSAPQ